MSLSLTVHRTVARAQKRDRQKNDVLASAGIPVMKDVDLRTIFSDYISVASPQPTQGIGPSATNAGPLVYS